MPDEDASKAKNFRFAPWQLVCGLLLFATVAVTIVLSALTYTPLGVIFPLSNPGLENKYSKELVSLNTRMMRVMEQLIDLQAYNIKLRRALGENVVLSDSGAVLISQKSDNQANSASSKAEPGRAHSQSLVSSELRSVSIPYAQVASQTQLPISFPAMMPTEGYLTRGFEPERNHTGIDIAGKIGTAVVAAADGNIVFSGWTFDDGYVVIISHPSGFLTYYKHNQSLIRSTGSLVHRGDPIATLGNSGSTSSGPHLHFEIWKDGIAVDPSLFMINFYL